MNVRSIVVVCLLLAGVSISAQTYPMPAAAWEPAAICTGCDGNNSFGVSNDGLPTQAYGAPFSDHVGRIADSYDTSNVQNFGMRTVRARAIRVAPAGDRIYVALGEAVGAYSLETFFTETLLEPMQGVNKIVTGHPYGGRNPFEKVALPDAYYYPEAKTSGWTTFLVDAQQTLGDFDADDRGLFYGASRHFGWGIHNDDRRTNGTHIPFLSQRDDINANKLFAFRSGETYYAFVSDYQQDRSVLYDVTDPAAPSHRRTVSDDAHVVLEWSRHDASARVATLAADGAIRIHTFTALIDGAAAAHTFTPPAGKTFSDLSFDEDGNLWIAERGTVGSSNVLKKAAADGTVSSFDIYGSPFNPTHIHAGAGYIAVGGIGAQTGANARELRLIEVEPSGLTLVDTGHFFTRYYHRSAEGFARPQTNVDLVELFLIAHGGKTYLIYNANGLGDVYQIDDGSPVINSITPTRGGPAAATNVTLYGTNLGNTPTVTFGGFAASAALQDANTIVAIAPEHAPASVDVVVNNGTAAAVAPQQFTYALGAPGAFTASGASATSASVTWSAGENAAEYELQHYVSGAWSTLTTTSELGYVHDGLAADSAHVYRVRSLDGYGYSSPFTAADVASTVSFGVTDFAPGMIVRASHVAGLRNGVNALRAAGGLTATPFPSIAEGDVIAASHVSTLRTSLAEALAALGLPAVTFTDPSLASVLLKAQHFDEILYPLR